MKRERPSPSTPLPLARGRGDNPHPLHAELYDGIYGGPPPSPLKLRRYMRATGLGEPFQIIAAQYGDAPAPRFKLTSRERRRTHFLFIHPGMLYICFTGPAAPLERELKRGKVLHGEGQVCPSGKLLIRHTQVAIQTLRKRELAGLREKHGAELPLEAEINARNDALQKVRGSDGGKEWQPSARLWLDMVLLRHQKTLNVVRRKILEFFTQITREVDIRPELAFPFHRANVRLNRTFGLSLLAELCMEVLDELIRILQRDRKDLLTAGMQFSQPIQRAMKFMRHTYTTPIGLNEVAVAVHHSAPYLSRLFRKETGRTLTDYLQALRVQRARELLTRGDDSTLQIALACGFNAPEHFFRTFRRLAGMTPRAYRRAHGI